MSFSVDKKLYRGYFTVKYGEPFPEKYKNYPVKVRGIGKCNIYITRLGVPKWQKDLTVKILVWYYITVIYEGEQVEPLQRKRYPHLTLIK